MLSYFQAIWRCRYFWLSLVKMDLRSRYRGSVLGMGWSLLHPIAMTVILCTAFTQIFNQDLRTYAPFVMAGLACWNFVTCVIIQGCQCYFQGESYIRQFPAPMAIYPLRTVLGNAFHFGLALLLVLLLATWVRNFQGIRSFPSLLPSVLLLLMLGWSLAALFGMVNVWFRDTHHLSEVGLQVLFYLTPVIYPPTLLEGRRLGMLMHYNPLMPFLNLLREPILYNRVPSLATYEAAGLIVLLLSGTAALALRWQERRLIFHL
jgi:ABC-type polysaccharide/polyol phosphate export permease